MVFINLEKIHDKVSREILKRMFEKKGVRVPYVQSIKDMYENAKTSIKTPGELSLEFPIRIGLHQGSTLSRCVFALVIDKLIWHIQDRVPQSI